MVGRRNTVKNKLSVEWILRNFVLSFCGVTFYVTPFFRELFFASPRVCSFVRPSARWSSGTDKTNR